MAPIDNKTSKLINKDAQWQSLQGHPLANKNIAPANLTTPPSNQVDEEASQQLGQDYKQMYYQANTAASQADFPPYQQYPHATAPYSGSSLLSPANYLPTDYDEVIDRNRVMGIIDSMANDNEQLQAILNNPNLGSGMKSLIAVFAISILSSRKKIDKMMEVAANLDPEAQKADQQLLMANLSKEVRAYSRAIDTGANVGKVAHDAWHTPIRNITR